MTTEAYRRQNFFYWFRIARVGAYAGLIAGVPLSMIIVQAQILPVIGRFLRMEESWASLFIHLSLSAFFGAFFGIFAARFHLAVRFHFRFRKTLPVGMGYGALLWFINLLIFFPLLFPSSIKAVENILLLRVLFLGHLFFGAITAMLFTIIYWRSPRIWLRPPGASNWMDSVQGGDDGNKTIGILPIQKK